MSAAEICFWLCAAAVAYAYFGYPAVLALLARLRPRPMRCTERLTCSVSVVVAAHNEEANIARRIDELNQLIQASGLRGEILVVSDGSTDATTSIARSCEGPVRVLELAVRTGKAVALTEGCKAAANDLLVFADARQTWAPDALQRLVESFSDPAVGAVSGDLIVESAPGVLAGVGLYWRYEKWLRKAESRVHSMVSVTGAISAVRRELFRPIPPGTILDDMYWPLQVALQDFRVVHDPRAVAFDRLPERTRDEFRRKVRTLSGNFQLAGRLPAALLPWRNPVWLQLVSHKLLRLLVPWLLVALLALSACLSRPLYRAAFWLQVEFYLVGLAGLWRAVGARVRVASAAASLLVLNAAAWLAFWVWIAGRADRSWAKVSYHSPLAHEVGRQLRLPAPPLRAVGATDSKSGPAGVRAS
jgi:cellulose synthase/poly-beta-1,6-N-acetylglucosamine synthase-like glycosyltransferase